MKLQYVSISNAVQDWIQDNDLEHEEINESLLIRWAVDCVRWCSTPEQLKHKIAILQIENSRARLPDDFELLAQAASNVRWEPPCDCSQSPPPECCGWKSVPKQNRVPKTRREDIVQWVHGTMDKDCHLEINLVCPTCHKTACDCRTPTVEVDVDRIWEMAHPEIYYNHFTKIGRFGYGPGQNGPYDSYYTPKFKLMRYSTNDYFKLKHILTDCPNVNCDNCWREFVLDLPYIEVDFGEGEVLLSYLGKALDEKGEIMIPDHPDVFEAISNHLDYKYYRIQWKKTKNQRFSTMSREAMELRDYHIGIAVSSMEVPEFHQFKNYLESSSWLKRVPGWSSDYVGKRTPNISELYGDLLEGNTDD